ncbi:MAG: CBS domain-containing protein [Pseudomonadota bacterium]|nr:CBS domain-containing protein [Pseudomonadota bacterium]
MSTTLDQVLQKQNLGLMTINEHKKLSDIIDKLLDTKRKAILVTENNGDLVGMVSESDIVKAVGKFGKEAAEISIHEIMTESLIVAPPLTDAQEALLLMSKNKIRHLPVVTEHGHMLGVVGVVELISSVMGE